MFPIIISKTIIVVEVTFTVVVVSLANTLVVYDVKCVAYVVTLH